MRVLRVARASARKGRTQALNQMRNLVSTAPEPIRAELRGLSVFQLLERASTYRPGTKRDIVSLTKFSLRMLARRAITLEEEIKEIDTILKPLVKETAPELVATLGIGTDAASALLVAAGDNPGRLHNEAAFAHLCGASSIDASSGKNQRHRLNRSGDRQANSALRHIVLTRIVYDPRTTEYIDRRRTEGLTKKEAVRCLKRYVAREVYGLLPHQNWGLTAHRSIGRGQGAPGEASWDQPVVTEPVGGMVPGPVARQPAAFDGSIGAASVGGVRKAGGLVRSTESKRLSAAESR